MSTAPGHHSYKITNAVSLPRLEHLPSIFFAYLPRPCAPHFDVLLSCNTRLTLTHSLQVVLGGSSGIGFAVSEEFLRAGAKVLSLSRSPTAAAGAQHIHCDLSSHASIMAAASAVATVFGGKPAPISLVLNAGHHSSDSAGSVTQESLFQHLNINVLSQVQCQYPQRIPCLSPRPLSNPSRSPRRCRFCLLSFVTLFEQSVFTAQVLPLLAPTSSIIWIGSTLSDRCVLPPHNVLRWTFRCDKL